MKKLIEDSQMYENDASVSLEVQEEFTLLMSLSLDGLLAQDEATRFQHYQQHYPMLAAQWHEWQQLDQMLLATPHVQPNSGFVDRFATKLNERQRRRRVWWSVGVGLFTLLAWCSVIVGLAGISTYLLINQAHLLTGFVHNLAYCLSIVDQWFSSVQSALNTLLMSPQARSFGLAYGASVIAILGFWLFVLRRSTREFEVATVI